MVNATVAIIPARGGSKRIPGKNIVDFCGKPMIAWTIEAALGSKAFDRVLVSTDSEEIASVARSWGADVPFLRRTYADDESTVSSAVLSCLQDLKGHTSSSFSTVALLMANCPLRRANDVVAAMTAFERSGADFQLSCFEYGWMNPWWACTLSGDGIPTPIHPQALKSRSQDLPKLYCPTGAIWVARMSAFLASKTFYGPGHRMCPMPWQAALDIDDYEDLEMARCIHIARETTGAR